MKKAPKTNPYSKRTILICLVSLFSLLFFVFFIVEYKPKQRTLQFLDGSWRILAQDYSNDLPIESSQAQNECLGLLNESRNTGESVGSVSFDFNKMKIDGYGEPNHFFGGFNIVDENTLSANGLAQTRISSRSCLDYIVPDFFRGEFGVKKISETEAVLIKLEEKISGLTEVKLVKIE